MTQKEKNDYFARVIQKMKRSLLFAEAMSKENVTLDTALTLMQLAEDAHKAATTFRADLLQDKYDREVNVKTTKVSYPAP